MNNESQNEPMTFEKLQTVMVESVQKQYTDNGDPDFDIAPVAFVINEAGELCIAMLLGGPPHIMLPHALEKMQPTMYGFASAAWVTKADEHGNKTGERGEGVIFTFETKEQCVVKQAQVTRAPLPVLGEVLTMTSGMGRLTHLLCRPARTN